MIFVAFCMGAGGQCPTGPWPFKPLGTESFSRQQIPCVANQNKAAGDLLAATLKDRYACAKDASRGRTELASCLSLDRRGWIQRARDKFLAADLLFDDLFAEGQLSEPDTAAILSAKEHRNASRCQMSTLFAVRKVAQASRAKAIPYVTPPRNVPCVDGSCRSCPTP
ncbi:MAG: hypothetical protein P8R42_11780 [Candidatus Binatia bacterium]|nr:hypothetical protein [Candidatus Binatia bacterium]